MQFLEGSSTNLKSIVVVVVVVIVVKKTFELNERLEVVIVGKTVVDYIGRTSVS